MKYMPVSTKYDQSQLSGVKRVLLLFVLCLSSQPFDLNEFLLCCFLMLNIWQ